MTAFITIAYQDRVELMADGAVYAEDGTLLDIRTKIATGRSLAVMTRGNATAGKFMADAVALHSENTTFDNTMVWLQERLRAHSGKTPEFGFELIICGMSESIGPAIFYATTTSYIEGIPAWTLIDAGTDLAGGNEVPVDDTAFIDGLMPAGVVAMEAMRQIAGVNPVKPDLPAVFGIGGHIDHAVVRQDGVTVERVHHWPEDQIGQKIEPVIRAAA